MSTVPALRLNNGLLMPAIGLGTWQAKPGEVEAAVKKAIDVGYRHIDCAMVYGNEVEVGSAIRSKIEDGTVTRQDLFVTSKLWCTFHHRTDVVPECKKSVLNFGLDYIDLYLIHWPFAFQKKDPIDLFPRDEAGKVEQSDDDFVDTWKGMEECVQLGLAKSIGVSNFNSVQIQRILDSASIKPVTNQVECQPYLNQKKLTAWCKERGIVITAYSPLGSPQRPWVRKEDPLLLEDPRILDIAQRVKRTPAQVVLNYLLSLGVAPIPKSTNVQRLTVISYKPIAWLKRWTDRALRNKYEYFERLRLSISVTEHTENFNVFDFELTDQEKTIMNSIDCNGRLCKFNDAAIHKDYPFNVEF